LLDMFLSENPGRGRSDEEKKGIAENYKPGENVLPKVDLRPETEEEAADRRMIEEVRELSLRELDDLEPRRSREHSRDNRHQDGGRTRHRRDVESGGRSANASRNRTTS